MCAVSVRPLVFIYRSIHEMPTFIHFVLKHKPLAYGIMSAAFQGAPRSQPSEIMLSEWVSEWVTHRNVCELPRGVRDVMVCRSVCQKEADDRGATRVLPFLLQQWTKPGLVLFYSFVQHFRFPFNFICVSFSIHVRSVCCPLTLLVSLFFLLVYFCRSYPLCASHSF